MKCPKCGLENAASAARCDCGLDLLSGELQAASPTPEATGTAPRTPILAAVLSLLTSGVGQVYNGQAAKGFAFYAGQILLFAALGIRGQALRGQSLRENACSHLLSLKRWKRR